MAGAIGDLRQSDPQRVNICFGENFQSVLPEKRSSHSGTNMLPAGKCTIIYKTAPARRAAFDQQGEPAVMLARHGQCGMRTGDE